MTQYVVKIAFWLPAYVDAVIDAENDADAIAKARARALRECDSNAPPDHIEPSERFGVEIAYVDRVTTEGRTPVVEWIKIEQSSRAPAVG